MLHNSVKQISSIFVEVENKTPAALPSWSFTVIRHIKSRQINSYKIFKRSLFMTNEFLAKMITVEPLGNSVYSYKQVVQKGEGLQIYMADS